MPASDSEPDNYSIDDMMDRLRSRGEGGQEGDTPQLVTRPDGTQVYRVKKRKRRSRQPKKEKEVRQKRSRTVQIIVAAGLVVLLAASFFASLVFLNSSAYRDSIIAKIGAWTGAETKVTQLRVTPVSANADSIELVWPAESMVSELKLNALQGGLNFTKLLGGTWQGSEIASLQGGTLVLRPPTGKEPAFARPEGNLPFQFRYRSSKFNVRMGEETSAVFTTRGSEASLEFHDAAASSANLRLEGGTVNVAGWGDFDLELASLQFDGGQMRVGNVRVAPAGSAKGEIEFINLEKVPFDFVGGETKLPVQVADIALTDLLGASFGTLVSTTVETPDEKQRGEVLIRTSGDSGLSWRIPFRANATADTTAGGFPMFDVLAREVGEAWYLKPRFDLEAKGIAVRDKQKSGIESLVMDARGRLSIGGKIFADAKGNLDGELQVGLPSAAVDGGSQALKQVFHRKGGGSSWAKIRISGTSKKPMDDLEVQLKSSLSVTSPAAGGDKALEDAFEDLVTPGAR